MFKTPWMKGAAIGMLLASPIVPVVPVVAAAATPPHFSPAPPPTPSQALVDAARVELRPLLDAVLRHAPELVSARARAEAMRRQVDTAGRLPDPTASLTAFPLPPETRLGAQRLSLAARQALPRPQMRRLERQVAELRATQAEAEIEALSLRLLTRARRLVAESVSLRRQIAVLDDQELHLASHEESARARYAGGRGHAADAVRLQAALTRLQSEKLTLESRLAAHRVELSRLTGFEAAFDDIPAEIESGDPLLQDRLGLDESCDMPDAERLIERAQAHRPELEIALLERRVAALGVARTEQDLRPSFSVGLAYTVVDPRDDMAARLNPPPGNGDDILALTGGVTVPLWRAKNDARLAAAGAAEVTAGAAERAVRAEIRRQVEEPLARLAPLCRQVRLLTGVLMLQADEALRSSVAGYAAGTLDALALLDAEHRLFEVRSAAVRAAADLEIARLELEGAVGAPLPDASPVSTVPTDSTDSTVPTDLSDSSEETP